MSMSFLEIYLQISVPFSELRDLSATYNPYSLQLLPKVLPDVSFNNALYNVRHILPHN